MRFRRPRHQWITVRRTLSALLIVLVLVAPQITSAKRHANVTTGQPDIVVIMVDDLGGIDERILDRLPNIKSLFIDEGLRLDSAYSETPLCCPGRATFLTGQHTRNHGVVKNRARLLDPTNTIATALHDAGYYTMMVGKYLNYPDQLSDKTPPGWDKVAMLRTWLGNVWSSWWVQGRAEEAGYHDRFTLERSLRWLKKAPTDQPVFMWVTPRAPHWAQSNAHGHIQGRLWPWRPDVEAQYRGDSRCDDIPAWDPADYSYSKRPDGFPLNMICRSLLTVDEMVGDLRTEMAAQGRDPIWMFTSDNGMAWGADGYPLKNVPEAAKLPVYFSGPGVVHGSTDALISNIDFGPTLAALGGTTMPYADGTSFASLLSGGPGGRTSMLEDHPLGGYDGLGESGPWWGIRTPDWLLVEWNGTHLYDLRTDPLAMHDIAGERPDMVNMLTAMRPLLPAVKK